SSRSHKFHIEGRKDGTGTTKAGGLAGLKALAASQHAWSFRARSREDMMEWWNDVRMLCARYLVASEHMERSGPVAAAVRAAGYTSEDDDELEEGSSVEEEQEDDDAGDEDTYEEAMEELPSYSRPEVPTNGYAVPRTSMSDGAQPDPDASAVSNVNRQPSVRQREKAPEGREPRVQPEHEDALEPDVQVPPDREASAR
ncbi:hypothetical protein C0992_007698, partial [Termitomyces sp. T32_za158]